MRQATLIKTVLALVFFCSYSGSLLPAQDLAFSAQSESEIIGEAPELGVTFSSVLECEDYVAVSIRLENGKSLDAQVNFKERTFYISLTSMADGSLTELAGSDLQTFRLLYVSLVSRLWIDWASRVGRTLLVILNIPAHYAAGQFISISHEDTNQSVQSLCKNIGKPRTGTYGMFGRKIEKEHLVGPCMSADGDCFGRCGPNCGLPPLPYFKAFTQDCFNHDLCCLELIEMGLPFILRFFFVIPLGPCWDEWLNGVDDWLFAPNCNDIKGDWLIHVSGITCLAGEGCESVDFQTTARFSTFYETFWGEFRSSRDGRKGRIEGSFTLDSESRITGAWRIPTYLGPECHYKPLGYAHGTFLGDNKCGAIRISLSGSWGWYFIRLCTPAGDGTFHGEITFSRKNTSSTSTEFPEATMVSNKESTVISPDQGKMRRKKTARAAIIMN